jgi:hypothetical protein
MSWLAPLYLAGLLAVAGPIVFHLWRRTPHGRRTFSTLMFLSPTPPRVTSRSRIEQWLLLCLRALACLLLAFAFARPVWRIPAEIALQPRGGELVAVLVDTSASLQRDDLWRQTQAIVKDRLSKLGADATPALFSFDDAWRDRLRFADAAAVESATARELILSQLAELKPTWGGAQLGDALVRTAQALQEAQAGQVLPRPQRILLVTDFASGCGLEGLQSFDWPADIPVELALVTPKSATNAGLQYVAPATDLSDDKVRVRVTNAALSTLSDFTLRWPALKPGFSESRASQSQDVPKATDENASDREARLADKPGFDGVIAKIHVPPGQSRVVALPDPPPGAGSAVELAGDAHPFDNTLWLPYRQPQRCSVVYIGTDPADDVAGARFYWERALASNPRYEVTVATADHVPAADPPVLALVTHADPAGLALLPKLLAAGSHVVLSARNPDETQAVLRVCGVENVVVQEAMVRDYALWSELDWESAWLLPFADAQFADFSGVHFWKHRQLVEPLPTGTRLLVRFDDGVPAVAEFPVPAGKLWCFASSWHPQDSQLARSTKFVPLMWRILEHALGDAPVTAALSVGQALPMPRNETSWTITPPAQSPQAWTLAQGEFAETATPGQYVVQVDTRQEVYAVNVPPDESRTDPLPPEQLEAYGVRLSTRAAIPEAAPTETQLRQQQLTELEQHQQLWRWGVLIAVLFIVTETLVAAWKTRAVEEVS